MNWPRIIGFLLIVFAAFFLYTNPTDAADATKTFFGGVGHALNSLAAYVKALM